MRLFVLYDKSGIHSGRALGKELYATLGREHTVLMGRPQRLSELVAEGEKFDYVINVGWFGEINCPGGVVLNLPTHIGLSSNKFRARKKFVEKGISAPGLWETVEEIPEGAFPVIARTTHHSKGKGFWFCNTKAEVYSATQGGVQRKNKLITTRKGNRVWRPREVYSKGATHFLKFISNTREFRVHAIAPEVNLKDCKPDDYLVLKLSEKVPGPKGVSNKIIKNHDNGWMFSFPKDQKSPILDAVRDLARKTLAVFNLHWGAVDIIYCLDTKRALVLEINSSPCLTDDHANTLDKYAKGIAALVGARPKLERKKNPQVVPKKQKRSYLNLLDKVGI